jgi:SRSO17 transposase
VSRHGHAFIDRALYLPKEWTDDRKRLKLTFKRKFRELVARASR